jgi:hypothetical protein
MKKIILSVPLIALVGCSTPQPKVGLENVGKEVVVSSMNDESMPSWVKRSSEKSLYEDDGNVIAVSMNILPNDTRIDAGFKMGELNAKAAMAKTLESHVEHYAQAADEGFGLGDQTIRTITTEAAKITASNMRPGRRYYQRVAVTDDTGTPRTEIRLWTEITMSKDEFRKAMVNAARKASGKPAFSEAFARQVDRNFEKLVNGDDSASSERTPAKNEEQ